MKLAETKALQRIMAVALVVIMLLGLTTIPQYTMYAYEERAGVIYSEDKSLVETFKEPKAGAEHARWFEYGKKVTVIDEIKDEDGTLWYHITYELKVGGTESSYCHAKNVIFDENVEVIEMGVINANNVNVRNDAGTMNTTILVALYAGHEVEILGQKSVNSEIWYHVRCKKEETTYIGWVLSTYVTTETEKEEEIKPDENYEQTLRDAGFPESYIHSLAVLHDKYPNWVFVPVKTGLDWNDVLKAESASAINMVEMSADDAKKSVASTEYDWTTNTWVIRDGERWVTAHPDWIAYCMDPRNFLNETYIFQFESLSYSDVHNLEGVKSVLKNTFMDGTVTHGDGTVLNYADTFMEIGKKVNVSPYHLASRVKQEQGISGTSNLISGVYPEYEKLYNYFNLGAYGTPVDILVKRGLSYAKTKGWTTRYASLEGGAESIASYYITRGQDTLYFQKFNVVYKDALYRHQYMANVTAAQSEGKSVGKAYTDKNQAFVFRIPVYENMPKQAVSFNVKGSRNNYLKDIRVSGLSLTPTFTSTTTEYSIVVENDVDSITISATPVVEKSTISGTGTHNLSVGTNTIKVNCKSQSGDIKTYTLTVVRKEQEIEETPEVPETPDENKYTLTSDKYILGETYITGV
ncbi:MAG: SH3 domain-containing protein [Lachnospiraceae bacterium]|nr:SH3 domain-containing protein [Lachnospiraceae bacterium]